MTTPTSRLVLLAISVTVVLWASAFIGIRMAGSHLAPGPLALGRMLVGLATLSLVVVVRARRHGLRLGGELCPGDGLRRPGLTLTPTTPAAR